MNKTKFDIEIEEFKENFSKYKSKNIVLYGIGRMTATLVGALSDYNIIGLCDRNKDLLGSIVFGKKIIDREQAERDGDILIINTAPAYWKTIFSRISDWDIPIYYRNGQKAFIEDEIADVNNPYWSRSLFELRKRINDFEVISFDIFNTLIQRKYLSESDLFQIIQERCPVNKLKFTFAIERKRAASEAGPYSSLDEIYEIFQKNNGITDEERDLLKTFEFETDKQFITGRSTLVEICNKIENRELILVSDMYYSSDQIKVLLDYIGLNISKAKMYVSCELKKTKADGTLWAYISDKYKDRKILHIGDDQDSDIDQPKRNGIEVYYIMSPSMMLEKSSICGISGYVTNTFSSVILGLISKELFCDPFGLCKTKGHIFFHNSETLGYCLFGPLMFVFNKWLISKAKERRINNLLFFSREGYFLTEEYNTLVSLLGEETAKAHYFYISRRAAMNASIIDENDIIEVAGFPYRGSFKQYMNDRFNVVVDDLSVNDIDVSNYQNNAESLWKLLSPYKDEILYESRKQRDNYLRYIDTLNIKKNYGIVDSFLYGNTQYFLGKMLGNTVDGYYFLVNKSTDNKNIYNQDMFPCFQSDEDITGMNNELWEFSLFIESFFTAPHGMVLYIKNGSPVFDEKKNNQKMFHIRNEMHKGILRFFKDLTLYDDVDLSEHIENIKFVKKMFSVFMNDGFIKTDEFKQSFFYDNAVYNMEVPIFGD